MEELAKEIEILRYKIGYLEGQIIKLQDQIDEIKSRQALDIINL